MFLKQKISILEYFLKDHVTLTETWSNDAEHSALHHRNTLYLNIEDRYFNNIPEYYSLPVF